MKMLPLLKKFVNPAPLFLQQKWCWVKTHQADILLALFVVLLSLASFGTGYLVARSSLSGDITIETDKNGTTK
ncbi:MAG: hypothetical protein Greene041639_503 [Parcubacteria group bacterium Greene0416_39]|nr:MAG: hypothetical protein Greene041639_503 [Parcubacteria group bacterium Greene0416_39]